MSVALHRGGRVTALVDAFAGMPSANRSGALDLPRVIDLLKRDAITLKQLEEIVLKRGGLLSLAGTNDFRALLGFRRQGATEAQQEKIELILDYYARRISAAVLELSADGGPLRFLALTGGLARSDDLTDRIARNLADRLPLVRVPGSVEHESLAAGALRGLLAPEHLLDYARERDRLRERRERENQLIDTVIFERALMRKKPGSPILNLDELVDATCATVERHHAPIIGIVGAENDEAILAAKRANEAGRYRLARFQLIGDMTAINEIAYETDLVLDGENYAIVDSPDPVDDAVRMLAAGELEILMKGSMKTEAILRGVFRFLKDSGRLRKGELISHVVVMDIPRRSKLLLVTDAAVNTYPDEEKRVRIAENALKVARSLHIPRPKVGVISAIESVNPSVESSMEAERIAARFADRDDCVVEGPLSFDVAMDPEIAAEKRYRGKVAGTADILVMPDIDAGNVLYKTLTTQSGATCAGVILAGDTPMVLTSRGDTARSKLASISLAVKLYFELRSDR
jgi:phosphate butyryltransferase